MPVIRPIKIRPNIVDNATGSFRPLSCLSPQRRYGKTSAPKSISIGRDSWYAGPARVMSATWGQSFFHILAAGVRLIMRCKMSTSTVRVGDVCSFGLTNTGIHPFTVDTSAWIVTLLLCRDKHRILKHYWVIKLLWLVLSNNAQTDPKCPLESCTETDVVDKSTLVRYAPDSADTWTLTTGSTVGLSSLAESFREFRCSHVWCRPLHSTHTLEDLHCTTLCSLKHRKHLLRSLIVWCLCFGVISLKRVQYISKCSGFASHTWHTNVFFLGSVELRAQSFGRCSFIKGHSSAGFGQLILFGLSTVSLTSYCRCIAELS